MFSFSITFANHYFKVQVKQTKTNARSVKQAKPKPNKQKPFKK